MQLVFLVVEARGQALHLREDANFNLLQAAHLARLLVDRGVEVRVRLVIDGGQSVEEYSLLPYWEERHEEWRRGVALAANRRAARRSLVTELRDLLPFEIEVNPSFAAASEIASELFYAPLVARLSLAGRPREAAFERLAALRAPEIDLTRWAEVEELAAAFAGRPYLDLEEEIARRTLHRRAGVTDVRRLAPAGPTSDEWVGGVFERLIAEDLATRERPHDKSEESTLASRLLGVFPAVRDPLSGQLYFNSPTSCRVEHGKLRLAARDRFDLLAFEGSERTTFEELRERLHHAAAGRDLVAAKYPVVPRAVAADLAAEVAAALDSADEIAVVFLEGITGLVNPQTGGFLATLLRESLPPQVGYHRFSARRGSRELVPNLAGVLPLVEETISAQGVALFDPVLVAGFDPFG